MSLSTLLILIKKDLVEQWRTKKILILIIIFLFVAISSPIMAKLLPEILKSVSVPGMVISLPAPTYLDAIDQYIKNISQVALLVIIFIVAGAISDEKSHKTLEILLTKPVSRIEFILSKFKSYFISIVAIFAVCSTIFYFYTTSIFATFNLINFTIMAAIALLYILMIVAITILASTVVKNSIIAGGIGFASYIVFGTVFSLIGPLKPYSPGMIFDIYKDVVTSGWTNSLIWPLIITLIVIVLSVIFSIVIFRKQEIDR